MNNEVGFKPVRRCPVCDKYHTVEYQYKGIDILACPQMKADKMVLMHEDYVTEELSRLSNMQRVMEPKE